MSKKLLSRDEVVVRHMHTHIKVLLWRFVVEILLLVVGVVASVMAPTTWQPWGILAIWVGRSTRLSVPQAGAFPR